jgi:hypothetical protein
MLPLALWRLYSTVTPSKSLPFSPAVRPNSSVLKAKSNADKVLPGAIFLE